tara:strand:+ start:1486 stop:1587 length:102 start_codon:yes stop_codon:yes gene_type:complete
MLKVLEELETGTTLIVPVTTSLFDDVEKVILKL